MVDDAKREHLLKIGKPHQFKKGHNRNPKGRGAISPELRAIRLTKTADVKKKISRVFQAPVPELEIIKESKTEDALDVLLASTMLSAINKGDIFKIEMLFLRCLGKVKETIEIQRPEPTIIKRRDGSSIELGTTIEAEFEEANEKPVLQ